MHIKAENLFIQVLKDEMKKKGEALDLFYSFQGYQVTRISIMTETGSRQYKVDVAKSRKIFLRYRENVHYTLLFVPRSSYLS